MVKLYLTGAYAAPKCETAENGLEAILCESPEGLTEDFSGFEDFTW